MFITQTRVYFVFTIFIVKFTISISIQGISETRNSNEHLLTLPHMRSPDRRVEGIFERFIWNFLDLLTTIFPEKQLPKYCRILCRYINALRYKYARKFAKHVRYLSRMYPEDLRDKLMSYKRELVNKRPKRNTFLQAFNKAFTLQEQPLFDDYINELKKYGTKDKLYIHEETEKLMKDVFMKSIKRLSHSDQKELQKKLRYAVREFIEISNCIRKVMNKPG